jgi:hypothetical protein
MTSYPISTDSIKPTLSLIGTLFIMLGYSYFQNHDLFGLYCLISGIAVYIIKIITYHYMGRDSKDE